MGEHGDVRREGRYAFVLTRRLDPATLAGRTGLRGAPLEVVEHDGLQAVVCTVDLEEFGEDALRRNLEDLAWLEEVARAHDEVVHEVARHGTVAPLRLVTIYSDDDSVRRHLGDLADQLTAALDRVEGRSEWSVKVFATATAPDPEPASTSASSAGERPGATYLRRKREAAERRRASSEQATEAARAVDERLAAAAVASRRLAPQDPRLTGRSDPMVLNAAYLVPDEEADAFRALVDGLRGQTPGVAVELAGPWPPYSFATLDRT